MMENCNHNENNVRELTFEERLRKHLEATYMDPHFSPQESNREPYVLYPHSETSMYLDGSTRVPNATCMKQRGRF